MRWTFRGRAIRQAQRGDRIHNRLAGELMSECKLSVGFYQDAAGATFVERLKIIRQHRRQEP